MYYFRVVSCCSWRTLDKILYSFPEAIGMLMHHLIIMGSICSPLFLIPFLLSVHGTIAWKHWLSAFWHCQLSCLCQPPTSLRQSPFLLLIWHYLIPEIYLPISFVSQAWPKNFWDCAIFTSGLRWGHVSSDVKIENKIKVNGITMVLCNFKDTSFQSFWVSFSAAIN